jgi:hypothetical protein
MGYSAIQQGNVLGNSVQFIVKGEVDNHNVASTVSVNDGVQMQVQECNFKAIVEFQGHPQLNGDLYSPSRWHVGFVQNLTDGGIVYCYTNNQAMVTMATISPRVMPCKDSGSAGTWYDPSPFSVKRFGIDDEMAGDIPNEVGQQHPARTNANTRFVMMGDAPGTGRTPLQLDCYQADPQNRAQVNQQYAISWRDPLDANNQINNRAPLTRIDGQLRFTTWLAMSSEANLRKIKTTTLFIYLYYWDWVVTYKAMVDATAHTATVSNDSVAQLLQHGPCPPITDAIVTGNDANESIGVKFT